MAATIKKAFVLAAGLGTRLRPLTDQIPKPLIPVGQKPLITFAFDHLIADAGVEEFIVNTHHLPDAFPAAFPAGRYRSRPIHFRHEPVLLDTGGGIKNVADLLGEDEPFLVYNGDILTDLPIGPLIAAHRRAGNLVTLVLRSQGGPAHIAWDAQTGRVLDIRNLLGTGAAQAYSFACVYLVEPAFFELLPGRGEITSVIPVFLEMIRKGEKLGGIVIDEGEWRDLGNRTEYLRVHRDLQAEAPPSFHVTAPRIHAGVTGSIPTPPGKRTLKSAEPA